MRNLHKYTLLLIFTFGFTWALGAQEIKYKLLENQRVQIIKIKEENNLDKGKGVRKKIIGIILIDENTKNVWESISKWDDISKDYPGLEYYKIIHANSENTEQIITGKLDTFFTKAEYTLRVNFDPAAYSQQWSMLNKEEVDRLHTEDIPAVYPDTLISKIEGSQYLKPYKNNTQTLFFYSPEMELTKKIPEWIEEIIIKVMLKEYLRHIKDYSEKSAAEKLTMGK